MQHFLPKVRLRVPRQAQQPGGRVRHRPRWPGEHTLLVPQRRQRRVRPPGPSPRQIQPRLHRLHQERQDRRPRMERRRPHLQRRHSPQGGARQRLGGSRPRQPLLQGSRRSGPPRGPARGREPLGDDQARHPGTRDSPRSHPKSGLDGRPPGRLRRLSRTRPPLPWPHAG